MIFLFLILLLWQQPFSLTCFLLCFCFVVNLLRNQHTDDNWVIFAAYCQTISLLFHFHWHWQYFFTTSTSQQRTTLLAPLKRSRERRIGINRFYLNGKHTLEHICGWMYTFNILLYIGVSLFLFHSSWNRIEIIWYWHTHTHTPDIALWTLFTLFFFPNETFAIKFLCLQHQQHHTEKKCLFLSDWTSLCCFFLCVCM